MATKQADIPQQAGEGIADACLTENSKDGWDEAQLEEGLKTLKEMHIQARHLRSTIDRLIAPMIKRQESPQSLNIEFSTAVQTMHQELQTFKDTMTGEEAKKVLDYAKESVQKNPGPVKPWMYTEHPGWSTRDS